MHDLAPSLLSDRSSQRDLLSWSFDSKSDVKGRKTWRIGGLSVVGACSELSTDSSSPPFPLPLSPSQFFLRQYGADFVESSVKSISRPVVSRLGASLGNRGVEQLDDFACRQLDRVSRSNLFIGLAQKHQRSSIQ